MEGKKEWFLCRFQQLRSRRDWNPEPGRSSLLFTYTVNSEEIALVLFLLYLAFILGRKIKIRND